MPYSVDGDIRELGIESPAASIDGVEERIVKRIRALFDKALHPATPAPEAATALRLAQRELHTHQLDRARVMLATSGTLTMAGSRFAVRVRSDTNAAVLAYLYMRSLAHACAASARVKWYLDRYTIRLDFVFYGIATQARIAAEMFARYFAAIALKYAEYNVQAVIEAEVEAARGAVDTLTDTDVLCFSEALALYEELVAKARARNKRTIRDSYREGLVQGLAVACRAERAAERARVETLEAHVEKARRTEEARRACAALAHEQAAHVLGQLDATGAPAPLVDAELEAAEREVVACRALALHTESVAEQVLAASATTFDSTLAPAKGAAYCAHAYTDGKRDGKRMREDDR